MSESFPVHVGNPFSKLLEEISGGGVRECSIFSPVVEQVTVLAHLRGDVASLLGLAAAVELHQCCLLVVNH